MFDEILKKIEFFSLLSLKEMELINNSCKIITLNKNNILFYEGEIAKSFYILVQGIIKLYKTTRKKVNKFLPIKYVNFIILSVRYKAEA